MVLYKYKKKCLPLLKTAVFQDYICSRTIRLGPNSSAQKKQTFPPWDPDSRFLVKFPRMGKAIEVKCSTSARDPLPPPIGLNIDRCIILKTDKHSINCFTYLKSAQYKPCKAKYEYFEIKYLYLFYIYFFLLV